MPYTPAHAAAALPLRRLIPILPLDALIIGSMAPDFEYVLRLAPVGRFGHTGAGLFVFCLPLSLVVLAGYRGVVAPTLVALLRGDRAGRSGSPVTGRAAAAIVLAILLGALSHVLWDGVTHRGGWAMALVPALTRPVLGVSTYKLLQHGSTLLGAAVLGAALLRGWRGLPATADRGSLVRAAAGWMTFVLAAALANGVRVADQGIRGMAGYAAAGALAGGALGALVVALLLARRPRSS